MKDSEKLVHASLIAEGWTVLRNGWPDFLCVRGREVKAVEVKHGTDTVRPHQKANHRVLKSVGINVEIVYSGRKKTLTSRPRMKFIFRSEWQFLKVKSAARKSGISMNEFVLRCLPSFTEGGK